MVGVSFVDVALRLKGRGPCPAGFLRERKWARLGYGLAPCWHETKGMAGQPCPPCIVDPTKLKILR